MVWSAVWWGVVCVTRMFWGVCGRRWTRASWRRSAPATKSRRCVGGRSICWSRLRTAADGGQPEEERHCRVWWELDNGLTWRFLDIRRFGQLRLCPGDWSGVGGVPECLAGLGDEPLEDGFDGARLLAIGKGRRQAGKQVIMDQRLLVGVGNIYASESLFRAGIDPRRPFATLRRREADRLATAIREVLLESIEAGGTTISDFVTLDGSEGGYTVHLRVYGRQGEPCARCGATLVRMVQGGRSTFFCPHCQK